MQSQMKAAVFTEYGLPEDVLQLKRVVKPTPNDNEILVRIHSTTVSAVDAIVRSGSNFSARLFFGLRRPRQHILGGGFAGTVAAVGKDVTLYKKGDHVFGNTSSLGTHAEYLCTAEEGIIIQIPDGMTFKEAVSIPGALTPLYFLKELAQAQPGQKILINGASGGIGTFAVQLAKYYGTHVTGVCSTKNIELVKSLGADEVIDYTKADFTHNHNTYDVIFDTVGKSSFPKSQGALKRNGRYLTIEMTLGIMPHLLLSKFRRKKAIVGFAGLNQTREDFIFLKELAEKGIIKPVIDRMYPFDRIADAHSYVDTGRKRGDVVITIAS